VRGSRHERCRLNGALVTRQLLCPRGFAAGRSVFDLRIDFAAHQDEEAGDGHPGEQHDDGANTAVGGVRGTKAVDVEGEAQGRQAPAHYGAGGARGDLCPLLLSVGREIIQEGDGHDQEAHDDGPVRHVLGHLEDPPQAHQVGDPAAERRAEGQQEE
jgi:hypothetical protein